MSTLEYKVFISHGKSDAWLAKQLAKEIRGRGATTFLDETDIPKGGNFKAIVKEQVTECSELVALFTPWSAHRSWVWSEVGAAWGQNKIIIGILYGLTVKELEEIGEGKAMFEDINILGLNDSEVYFAELEVRVGGTTNA